jgi:hypothetical protein
LFLSFSSSVIVETLLCILNISSFVHLSAQEASETELDHAQLEIERILLGMAFSYTAPTVDTNFAELLASLTDVGPDHPQLKVRSESGVYFCRRRLFGCDPSHFRPTRSPKNISSACRGTQCKTNFAPLMRTCLQLTNCLASLRCGWVLWWR